MNPWFFIVFTVGKTEWSLCYTEASSFLPARCPKCSFLPTWCSSAWHWSLGSQLFCYLGWVSSCLPEGHRLKIRLDVSGTKGVWKYLSWRQPYHSLYYIKSCKKKKKGNGPSLFQIGLSWFLKDKSINSVCILSVICSFRARQCFLCTVQVSVWQETVAPVPAPTGHFSLFVHL